MAKELGVPFLGAVPIYQPIRQGADEGVPLMTSEPESPAGLAIMAAAELTAAQVLAAVDQALAKFPTPTGAA